MWTHKSDQTLRCHRLGPMLVSVVPMHLVPRPVVWCCGVSTKTLMPLITWLAMPSMPSSWKVWGEHIKHVLKLMHVIHV